ncbi:hypothetical protein G3480_17710 [Thiorhodococcus mannitoliphagus]|uniref:Uncharacterized protein n=1 Tax=Thiorhodococcus mannitoliphagus TaxID=329406 RepID=A0A6P1DWQ1_9GAMM|nr:hypothetical protein [Thiorhodococcus mannitoliphagus]NEX22119.1 hypothetical protein [Thiorhodococcus mannitoliphagus]
MMALNGCNYRRNYSRFRHIIQAPIGAILRDHSTHQGPQRAVSLVDGEGAKTHARLDPRAGPLSLLRPPSARLD